MNRLQEIYKKYKMQASYLLFGVATTLVNVVSYYFLYEINRVSNVLSTGLAWLFSVIFAFITNKIWVFESKSCKPSVLVKEGISFFSCRVLTGILEVFLMWVGVDILHLVAMVMKGVVSIIVILLNYIVSKKIVFQKADTKEKG